MLFGITNVISSFTLVMRLLGIRRTAVWAVTGCHCGHRSMRGTAAATAANNTATTPTTQKSSFTPDFGKDCLSLSLSKLTLEAGSDEDNAIRCSL